jgi:hypothetical protein
MQRFYWQKFLIIIVKEVINIYSTIYDIIDCLNENLDPKEVIENIKNLREYIYLTPAQLIKEIDTQIELYAEEKGICLDCVEDLEFVGISQWHPFGDTFVEEKTGEMQCPNCHKTF